MKKLAIVGAIVAVLLVVVGVVVFLNLDRLVKRGVETVGPKITKTEVRLEGVNLSPFSGSGKLKGLFVGNPQGFKTPSAIEVGSMEVQLNLSSLKSDKIVVERVVIQQPVITFEGTLSGSNLKRIMDNVEAVTGSNEDTGTSKTIQIKELTITGGKINFSFTGLGGRTMNAPLPDIHLTNIGTDDKGATVAQATKQVLGAVVSNVDKIAAKLIQEVGKVAKDAVNTAVDQVDKAAQGVKKLFK